MRHWSDCAIGGEDCTDECGICDCGTFERNDTEQKLLRHRIRELLRAKNYDGIEWLLKCDERQDVADAHAMALALDEVHGVIQSIKSIKEAK